MNLDRDACYRALVAHDPRFDGLFFVGVSSTGIYCRTVCPAKSPKRENCTFYRSAAEAEEAGYRPCLRCRPEIAPGRANIDAVSTRARLAAKRIEESALEETSIPEIASDLGISERHLRRIMQEELGVSPVSLLQTQRLLSAKQLLTDTKMSIGEVAFASGFSSLRRFNSLFLERYGMPPTALRKQRRRVFAGDVIHCEIPYRPPYDWKALLSHFSPRAVLGVESVGQDSFARTVRLKDCRGWLRATRHPSRPSLVVEVAPELGPVLPAVLRRVRRLFDINAEPIAIGLVLGELAAENPGLRTPGAFEGFEVAVRAIVGQQISVRFATELMARFVTALGEPIETPVEGLNRIFPTVEAVAACDPSRLGELGIIGVRSRAIVEVARRLSAGELRLSPGTDVDEAKRKLQEIKGIGPWTAEYVVMRALCWPDAFPHGDLGIRKALDMIDSEEALALAEQWRPWRAYAAAHLWKSSENFMTYFSFVESPIDQLLITSDGESLTRVYMNAQKYTDSNREDWRHEPNDSVLQEAARQLRSYFAGSLREFELPLRPSGTEFQKEAWAQLSLIPYGTTRSYGEQAKRIGDANASRAVGSANGKNPISIVVPCHRVIGANGSLTGFGGGLERKALLLGFESAMVFGESAEEFWAGAARKVS